MKFETKCGTLYKNNVGTIVQKQVTVANLKPCMETLALT